MTTIHSDDTSNLPVIRSYSDLALRIHRTAQSPDVHIEDIGSFCTHETSYPMFLVHLGAPGPGKVNVLLSAGIHGDEPAGVEAALRFIELNSQNNSLLSHYHFIIFPCDNPYGWERNVRENSQGLDLNRQFATKKPAPEAQILTYALHGKRFDLVYEMHEDYDSPGFYLYEIESDPAHYLGESIIFEIQSMGYPVNSDSIIEHRRAKNGIIRVNHVNYRRTGLPKALYSHRIYGAHVLTMETPSTALPLDDRVNMHLIGLNVSLNRAWLRKDAMSGI